MKIIEYFKSKFLKKNMELEIFQQCMFLRNLAILQNQKEMSGDYIFETLAKNNLVMKPIYMDMLRLYRTGQEEEAFDLVRRRIGGRLGANYSRLLEKLDSLTPAEMLSQISSFQETIRERRISANAKQVESHSIIATLFATIVIFAILLNFTVVVVMMDTIRMIKESF